MLWEKVKRVDLRGTEEVKGLQRVHQELHHQQTWKTIMPRARAVNRLLGTWDTRVRTWVEKCGIMDTPEAGGRRGLGIPE